MSGIHVPIGFTELDSRFQQNTQLKSDKLSDFAMFKISDPSQVKNTAEFFMEVVKLAEHQINCNLTSADETRVLNIVNEIPPRELQGMTWDTMVQYAAMRAIRKLPTQSEHVDIHEVLKNNLGETVGGVDPDNIEDEAKDNVEVTVDSFFGIRDIPTLVKKINEPVSSINTAHLLLDTRYRILENDGTTYFKWGHINSLARSQGTVNSIGDIRDVVSVRMMPFRMPAVETATTAYNRISVFIKEFCPQSYVAHEDRRFHFIGNWFQTNNWLNVDVSDYSDGAFKFNKPMTRVDTITLTLGAPLEPIIFDKDRLPGTIIASNPTLIIFNEDHNLATNDVIYITDFTTSTPTIDDATINIMNRQRGHSSTVSTATSITIPVDTSGLTISGTNEVYFGSKRIFFTLELVYLAAIK